MERQYLFGAGNFSVGRNVKNVDGIDMAQEKEDFSNKSSPNNNSDSEDEALVNGNNTVKPDLGFENVNYANNSSESDGNRTDKKTTNQPRKEESPFSFKHFLKRDLSLPSASGSYEGTGARPKVYSAASREGRPRPNTASSDSSIQLGCVIEGLGSWRREGGSDAALGLPDFVQDHLLVEQAYGGASPSQQHNNGPLPHPPRVDNLPDFTFNSPYHSPDWISPKVHEVYEDWDGRGGGGGGGGGLTLDLTDCVERPQPTPHPFPLDPLDLPPNAKGGESQRLPDFLPAQVGEGVSGQCNGNGSGVGALQEAEAQLAQERRLRTAAQRELRASQQEVTTLRRELSAARSAEQRARRELSEAASHRTQSSTNEDTAAAAMVRDGDPDSLAASLQAQIEQLRLELRSTQSELEDLRNNRRSISRSLTHATNSAEASLRDLLSGLEQVRGLASSLDPP